jgi:DNA-binding cell septation regulator SpoVG
VSSDEKNDTVISAPFTGKANEPNINYMDDKTQSLFYQSKRIYVYGKIHKISGLDHDSEIVIEHIPITNGTKKIFSCFLLKNSPDQPDDDISKFITNRPTNPLYISFNEYITQDNTAIVYDTVTADKEPCTIIIL